MNTSEAAVDVTAPVVATAGGAGTGDATGASVVGATAEAFEMDDSIFVDMADLFLFLVTGFEDT
jgi:hypothetical protein